MPGEISRSYKGPKDGRVPTWMEDKPMRIIERLESEYNFECEAGPLKNCVEWQRLRNGIATAIAALEKTKKEFEVSGKPAGYVGTIYVDTALAALSHC